MKADTKKITGKEANELIEEEVFEENDTVYIFDAVSYEYLESEDEELNELHACIVNYQDEAYFTGTEGISYVVGEKYYYDKENNILYIEENDFFANFQKLQQETEKIILKEFIVDKDELILLAEDDKGELREIKTVLNEEGRYVFSFENDFLDEKFASTLHTEVRDFVLANTIEAKYSAYEYATQSHTTAEKIVIEAKDCYDNNKKYQVILEEVNLDNTGNCFFGGFSFEDYEIEEM